MPNKLSTLEDFMKKYISNQKLSNGADSFETYKFKNGVDYDNDFNKAAVNLYANKKKNASSYGANYRNLANKGLQNSGYADYIDNLANLTYASNLSKLENKKSDAQKLALGGYSDYLEKYSNKQTSLKKSVSSHLIKNNVVNLEDAIAYGLSMGLSQEDAIAIGENAYSVTKQKVYNDILKEAVSFGLDKEGAVMLAKKMGMTDSDAEAVGEEVREMMSHYQNVSQSYLDYLKYLEEKSSHTTNTFK